MKFKHENPSLALTSSKVLGAAQSNSVFLLYYSGRLPNRITLRSHKTWICPCIVWAYAPARQSQVHLCLPPYNPSPQLLGIPDRLVGSYTVGATSDSPFSGPPFSLRSRILTETVKPAVTALSPEVSLVRRPQTCVLRKPPQRHTSLLIWFSFAFPAKAPLEKATAQRAQFWYI